METQSTQDLKPYEVAKQKLEAMISELDRKITTTAIPFRTDREKDPAPKYYSTHFEFKIERQHARSVLGGEYSKGCADVIEALRRGIKQEDGRSRPLWGPLAPSYYSWETVLAILEGKMRPSYAEGYRAMLDFMFYAAKKLPPKPVDILAACLMDASLSDQDFETWASDLDYDTDSMKAHKIWEACNATRRKLKAILGDRFEEAAELANEL